MLRTLFPALILSLAFSAPAFALRSVMIGNQPFQPGGRFTEQVLAIVNIEERVYMYDHEGTKVFYFKGGPKSLNLAMKRFAMLDENREIILLPAPSKPIDHGKQKFEYDWILYLPAHPDEGLRRFAPRPASEISERRATLTIYVPELMPAPVADATSAKKWIAELDSRDFKTRERATNELTKLGKSASLTLRQAMKTAPAESRTRIEKILEGISKEIRLDVLELPVECPVIGLDDLLKRARKELASTRREVRADAASYIGSLEVPAEEIIPDLVKLLKDDNSTAISAGVARAAYQMGPAARPLLGELRKMTESKDANASGYSKHAIELIEKNAVEPVDEAAVKKRAAIRKEIREVLESRNAAK